MYRKTSTSSEQSTSSGYFSNDSSPESPPPPRYDPQVLAQIRYILEEEGWREGWPLDYDWTNVELRAEAFRHGTARYVKLLLEKSCTVVGHCTTNPTLHKVVKNFSWPKAIEQLASLKATLDDRNCRGDTAVHLGLIHGATDGAFEQLLEKYLRRAKVNLANSDGLTLLHVACAKAPTRFVREVLQRFRRDVNLQVSLESRTATRTKFPGYTPLHFAVLHDRVDVARLLLECGADMCIPDRTCTTPLHLALYGGNTDMIDCILEYDRKWENCVNSHGLTHFMAACAGTQAPVVEMYLLVAKLKDSLPPSSTVKLGVVNQIKQEFAGYTALHFAAENDNVETTRLLLEYGAPTHAKTAMNDTPLTLAHKYDNEKVVRMIQMYSDKQQRFDKRAIEMAQGGNPKPIVGRVCRDF